MKKTYIYILIFIFSNLSAQDRTLLSVADDSISVDDFMKTYYKNRLDTDTLKLKDSLEEYMDLYINFRLKVIEAKKLGLDTLTSFTRELEGYRRQLVKPYLTNTEITEQLLKEAYERLKYEVSVSHILIQADEDDTLVAYNESLEIIERLKNGEDFIELARKFSKDPSVKDNDGNLGYFTAFYMVYPFETASYETSVGHVSRPIKTRFGYHIIKVNDKRLSRGEVKVAHIMIKIDDKAEKNIIQSRDKIYEIYDSLLLYDGSNFSELAKKYSDDKKSGSNGGELDWFGTNKMVKDFEDQSFLLDSIGEFSKPFKTEFGWHIVKLIDRKKLPSFDELKASLKNKVERDSRSQKTRDVVISRLQNEWDFVENHLSKDLFHKIINIDSFRDLDFFEQINGKGQVMFMFNNIHNVSDRYVYQKDFAEHLMLYRDRLSNNMDIKSTINQLYKIFKEQKILEIETKNLEFKYDDFRLLIDEYHDGILLFNLSEEKIWDKAIQDTVGLQNFYKKNSANYMWSNRVALKIYSCKNEKISNKVFKKLNGRNPSQIDDSNLLKLINKKSALNLSIEETIYELGDDSIVDKFIFENWSDIFENWKNPDNEQHYMVSFVDVSDSNNVKHLFVVDLLEPSVKPLNSIKGIVISDYQSFLEQEWLVELKMKYPVIINKNIWNLTQNEKIDLSLENKPIKNYSYCTSFSSCFSQAGSLFGYSKDVYFGWNNNIYTTELKSNIGDD